MYNFIIGIRESYNSNKMLLLKMLHSSVTVSSNQTCLWLHDVVIAYATTLEFSYSKPTSYTTYPPHSLISLRLADPNFFLVEVDQNFCSRVPDRQNRNLHGPTNFFYNTGFPNFSSQQATLSTSFFISQTLPMIRGVVLANFRVTY